MHRILSDKANDVAVLDGSVLISCTNPDGSFDAAELIKECNACDDFLEDAAPGNQRNKPEVAS